MDPADSMPQLRQNTSPYGTNTPHEPGSVLQSDRRPHSHRFAESRGTIPEISWVRLAPGPGGSRKSRCRLDSRIATSRLDDSSPDHRASAPRPGFRRLGGNSHSVILAAWLQPGEPETPLDRKSTRLN